MEPISESKLVKLSGKVYTRLLAIYPSRHRREYGEAMTQLFRDQCREVWARSGAWGLSALWLRVLPDLLKTSTAEHSRNLKEGFLALNELPHAIRNDPGLRVIFRRGFVAVFLLTFGYSALMAIFAPKIYSGMARIEVLAPQLINSPAQTGMGIYDPYAIQTQFELAQSDVILGRVVRNLNLADSWAKSLHVPRLSEADTIKRLRSGLQVRPTRNASLLELRFYGRNAQEAADIANELAQAWHKFDAEKVFAQSNGNPETAIVGSPSITIVDLAEADPIPVRPKRNLILFVGIFGGMVLAVLGGGAGVLFTFFRRRNQRPQSATP